MRARKMVPFVSLVLVLLIGAAGAGARTATPTPVSATALDPDCIRFIDPSAVIGGEIAYASFTRYTDALAHAMDVWSPERGFTIPLRQLEPDDDAVPAGAGLIVRDAVIPGSAFKGVTVTWANAPSTITLNLAMLPLDSSSEPHDRQVILSVMAHELGHALGLGDVPAPGVTIRECAGMLMKRSVDKGGGAFIEPQAADIALYCLRWGGDLCGDRGSVPATPVGRASPIPVSVSPDHLDDGGDSPHATVEYRFFVLTCETLPAGTIIPDDVVTSSLPPGCRRAPPGILFGVHRDDGVSFAMLTNGRGEFAVWLPDGVTARVAMDAGDKGRFPSLVGYRPLDPEVTITGNDPGCTVAKEAHCAAAYILLQ